MGQEKMAENTFSPDTATSFGRGGVHATSKRASGVGREVSIFNLLARFRESRTFLFRQAGRKDVQTQQKIQVSLKSAMRLD